ncbi:MAG TPA: divalent metal cation transporter [Armatimonadota bacterium]|nr:divalent metal cation transporter [Armatimonadota bacterium]
MRKRLGRHRWAVFLAVIGPGLIAANADNDAGGITTCSLVGARFGYSLLWVLFLITISLAVTQEMGARMGAVTGKGFGGLIREKFGARWATFPITAMLIANLGTTNAEFAGIAASLGIFGLSKYISVPVAAVVVYLLIAKFDYRRVQKVLLISSSLYLAYVVSGVLAHPDWLHAFRSMVRPTISFRSDYLLMFVALIGTTITPWGQFFIQSYIVDKRLTAEDLAYTKSDVYVGAFFTELISFFIIVACAATIFVAGGQIGDAADAAKALQPLAGPFASTLFALGLLNASLLGAAVLPLTSAYATCETFGWEAGIDKTPKEAPIFFGLLTFFIVASALFILIPGLPLLTIIVLSQVLNGVLLPIILIFVLKVTNDSSFMGKHTNSRTFNVIAVLTIAGLILMTILLLASPVIKNLI